MEKSAYQTEQYGYQQEHNNGKSNGEFEVTKIKVLTFLRTVSTVLFICATASIGIGVAIVVLGEGSGNPVKSGVQIWTSAMVLVGAVMGLVLGMYANITEEKNQKCRNGLIFGIYISLIIALGNQGWNIGNAIWGIVVCSDEDSDCGSNYKAELALYGAALSLGFLMFIGCISVIVTYFCSRKYFCSNNKCGSTENVKY